MKAAHEVLHEMKVARLRTRAEEEKWAELRRQCKSPAVIGFTWLGAVIFVTLIGALWLRSHPRDWKGLPFMPFTTLLILAPGVFVLYRKRHEAMLRIIEMEAPQLHQKLKSEEIA